jgi:hypothetical protein
MINIKRKTRDINGNVVMELLLQRFVAQQVTIIEPPPND